MFVLSECETKLPLLCCPRHVQAGVNPILVGEGSVTEYKWLHGPFLKSFTGPIQNLCMVNMDGINKSRTAYRNQEHITRHGP